MVPTNYKQKLLDEIISQKTLFTVLFTVLIFAVKVTENQASVITDLIYASLGASAVRSVAGGVKAMAAAKAVQSKE